MYSRLPEKVGLKTTSVLSNCLGNLVADVRTRIILNRCRHEQRINTAPADDHCCRIAVPEPNVTYGEVRNTVVRQFCTKNSKYHYSARSRSKKIVTIIPMLACWPVSRLTSTSFAAFAEGPLMWWGCFWVVIWRHHGHTCPFLKPVCDPVYIRIYIQLEGA
jgi:hypothetical protein